MASVPFWCNRMFPRRRRFGFVVCSTCTEFWEAPLPLEKKILVPFRLACNLSVKENRCRNDVWIIVVMEPNGRFRRGNPKAEQCRGSEITDFASQSQLSYVENDGQAGGCHRRGAFGSHFPCIRHRCLVVVRVGCLVPPCPTPSIVMRQAPVVRPPRMNSQKACQIIYLKLAVGALPRILF